MTHKRGSMRPLGRKSTLLAGVSTAMLIVTGVAAVNAQDVTIDKDTKEALKTSTVNNSTGGNILIDAGVEVKLSDPGTVVTVDSSHNVTNDGTILNESDGNSTGIAIDATNPLSSIILNNSEVQIGPSAIDKDPTAANFGIHLSGTSVFTGNIQQSSTGRLLIKSLDGAGIQLDSEMVGDILNEGSIVMAGEGADAIRVNKALTGNIINDGVMTSQGVSSTGIKINADITGTILNGGSITSGTTAYYDRKRRIQQGNVAEAGVLINHSVSGGFLNIKSDEDAEETYSGSILVRGDGPALWVTTDQGDDTHRSLVIGHDDSLVSNNLFGINNSGSIEASGAFDGISATGIRLEGSIVEGSEATVLVEGGLSSTGTLKVQTTDNDSTGILVGDNVTVPTIQLGGSFTVTASRSALDENFDGKIEGYGPGGTAIGILINESASVSSFVNENATVQVVSSGDGHDAYFLRDLSGDLNSVINRGTVAVNNSDEEGLTIAFDLSKAKQDVTFVNEGVIVGDVLFNTGNQTVQFDGGAMLGDMEFANSTGTLMMVNESNYRGALHNAQNLNVVLSASSLDVNATVEPTQVASFTATDNARIKVRIDPAGEKLGGLNVLGTATLGSGTELESVFDSFGFDDATYTVLTANNLVVDGGLDSISSVADSYLFDTAFSGTVGANGSLSLAVHRKTSTELGLSGNRAALYEGSLTALRLDPEFGAELANIKSGDDFADMLNQMMPQTLTGTTREIANSMNNLSYGAVRDRLGTIRQLNAGLLADGLSQNILTDAGNVVEVTENGVWGQEFFYEFNRDAIGEFNAHGGDSYGVAIGYDREMFGLDAVGVSLTHIISSFEDQGRFDDQLLAFSTQLGGYASYNQGGFFVDTSLGLGFNSYNSDRRVVIGDVVRDPEASWTGFQMSTNATAGYRLNMGPVGLTLFGGSSTVTLKEKAFSETSGGNGLNMHMEKRDFNSIRMNAGSRLDAIVKGAEYNVMFSLEGGASQELRDDAQIFNTSFVAGGDTFSLISPTMDKRFYNAAGGISLVMGTAVASLNLTKEWSANTKAMTASVTVRFRF